MDREQPDQHPGFDRSRERFLALVELLKSDAAMSLSLGELEALVAPGFEALMAQLRQDYQDLPTQGAADPEPATVLRITEIPHRRSSKFPSC